MLNDQNYQVLAHVDLVKQMDEQEVVEAIRLNDSIIQGMSRRLNRKGFCLFDTWLLFLTHLVGCVVVLLENLLLDNLRLGLYTLCIDIFVGVNRG